LTEYISAANRAIPDIFQGSTARRNVYKMTENRWSTSENAATAEGQTCDIARYMTLAGTVISYNVETVADRPTIAIEVE